MPNRLLQGNFFCSFNLSGLCRRSVGASALHANDEHSPNPGKLAERVLVVGSKRSTNSVCFLTPNPLLTVAD